MPDSSLSWKNTFQARYKTDKVPSSPVTTIKKTSRKGSCNLIKSRTSVIHVTILILISLLVYKQTFFSEFLSSWDDPLYVTRNPDVTGFTFANLKNAFSLFYVGNYAPLHIISYMLDYEVAGLSPAWFHLSNVLYHILNGLLFYLLVTRLSGSTVWAFAAAAIFLLHPLQVESVAWISQRKNVLAMFFFLLSYLNYTSYRRQDAEHGHKFYVLSLLFFSLAVLSKSVAIILPAVLILNDVTLDKPRKVYDVLKDKIPYIVLSVMAIAMALVSQSKELGGGISDYYGNSKLTAFFAMLAVMTRYLYNLFIPLDLSCLYYIPVTTAFDAEIAVYILIVLLLLFLGYYLLRSHRVLFFGYSVFFVALLPVSGIIPLVTVMNDRYMYFPLLGAAWLVGGVVSHHYTKHRSLSLVILSGVVITLALFAWQRTFAWKNSVTLWSAAVQHLSAGKAPSFMIADAHTQAGNKLEALKYYEMSFSRKEVYPNSYWKLRTHNNAATLYMDLGLPGKAFPILISINSKYPRYIPGFINTGIYYYRMKNYHEAIAAFERILTLSPNHYEALFNIGNIYLETGRLIEARNVYQKMEADNGNNPMLHYNMACVESLSGNIALAYAHLEKALSIGFSDYEAIAYNRELELLRGSPGYRNLMSRYFKMVP